MKSVSSLTVRKAQQRNKIPIIPLRSVLFILRIIGFRDFPSAHRADHPLILESLDIISSAKILSPDKYPFVSVCQRSILLSAEREGGRSRPQLRKRRPPVCRLPKGVSDNELFGISKQFTLNIVITSIFFIVEIPSRLMSFGWLFLAYSSTPPSLGVRNWNVVFPSALVMRKSVRLITSMLSRTS